MKKAFSDTFEWLCDNFDGLKPFSFDSKSDNDSRQFVDRDKGNGCLEWLICFADMKSHIDWVSRGKSERKQYP